MTPQVEQKSYRESLAEILRRRYAGVKVDVMIACNPAALNFATEYRGKVFQDVPIVFVGVGDIEMEGQRVWPGVTGVVTPSGFRQTIDLALRLQPDTRAVAIVAGATRWDSFQLAGLHSELVRYQDKLKEIDIVGPPNQELLQRVAALPPHTVVMFQVYPQFSDEPNFGTWDLLSETARRLPTYSAFPRICIDGCIGGAYVDNLNLLTSTGSLAAQVLSGVRPEDIPIVRNSGPPVHVDWRALQRWQISESAVPTGALLLHREPTLWERGRKYFIAGLAVMIAQTLLILGLFWQRARRRKAEIERWTATQLLVAIVDSSDDAIVSKSLDGVITSWNAGAERLFGYTAREALNQHVSLIIPFNRRSEEAAILERLREGERIEHFETVRLSKDGTTLDISLTISPLRDAAGNIIGASKIARDITQRKQMDQTLRERNAEILERSEQLRLAAQGSQMGLWHWNEVTKEMFWDARAREMFGVPVDGEVTLETFYGVLHPDDLELVTTSWRYALEQGLPYEKEYRSLSPDGTTRWIYCRGSAYCDAAAKPIRMVGVFFDITRRKQIEHEHLELSGRLIKAHEEERRRIARELHDDFSQRLVLVTMELQIILDAVGNSQPNVIERVRKLVKEVNEFGADVHALSHSLHSSKLEMLGLSRSVSSFCREFSKQHKIEIDFRQEAVPESVPSETALCLFRLVQEGLQNVRKHSRASQVEVRLAGSSTEISLILCDNGVGFDLSQNHASNGIGILSMKERTRMLHGTLEIQSAPMKGTQITVKIPHKNDRVISSGASQVL